MSKAFTKDDDAADAPLVLPRRAPLPVGTPNYVTAAGLSLLRAELAAERGRAPEASGSDAERARQASLHAARTAELEQRLASAVLVESSGQAKDEVRFGASVRFENAAGVQRRVRIVGVDEANAAEGAIAFVAPLARALLGKRVGDAALLRTPGGEEELRVLEIHYE
ncbi:MAG: transcription elongation factor GreAB [Myxococcales bacterium]|nr:MAG: transcription elongation factor GreAB [Myxococcales bacterium]